MHADDVITSYVHDVARRLPRAQRDDVAFELRTLLADDLRARAEAAGRSPDEDMAVEMVRTFGRPSETAVRYSRPFTIIAPSDTWSFLVAAILGGVFLPSPAWLGVLVVVFGVKSLIVRRRPDAFPWKPRPVPDRDPNTASRGANVAWALALAGLPTVHPAPGQAGAPLTGRRGHADTLAYMYTHNDHWQLVAESLRIDSSARQRTSVIGP